MYKRQVIFVESERGWGSKVDSVEFFDNDEAAKKRVEEFNKRNNLSQVPDWYMYAELGSIVDVDENGKVL